MYIMNCIEKNYVFSLQYTFNDVITLHIAMPLTGHVSYLSACICIIWKSMENRL